MTEDVTFTLSYHTYFFPGFSVCSTGLFINFCILHQYSIVYNINRALLLYAFTLVSPV